MNSVKNLNETIGVNYRELNLSMKKSQTIQIIVSDKGYNNIGKMKKKEDKQPYLG